MKDVEKTAQDCGQVAAAERVTVALIPKAVTGLAAVQARTRLSKTDVVNRGISLYEFFDAQVAAGNTVLIRQPDGTVREVMFF